jgi:hypothetical protein
MANRFKAAVVKRRVKAINGDDDMQYIGVVRDTQKVRGNPITDGLNAFAIVASSAPCMLPAAAMAAALSLMNALT